MLMIYNSLATKQDFSIVEDTDGHTFIFFTSINMSFAKSSVKNLT